MDISVIESRYFKECDLMHPREINPFLCGYDSFRQFPCGLRSLIHWWLVIHICFVS